MCIAFFLVNHAVTPKISKLTYLSNQAVFCTCPKSQDKNLNILRTNRVFKMKLKVFFIIFEGLSLKQIKKIFLEGESEILIKSCNQVFMTCICSLKLFNSKVISQNKKHRVLDTYYINDYTNVTKVNED